MDIRNVSKFWPKVALTWMLKTMLVFCWPLHFSNADLPPQKNRTPLHRAALKGHTDCCRLLIEAGADRNARTNVGLHHGLCFFVKNLNRLATGLCNVIIRIFYWPLFAIGWTDTTWMGRQARKARNRRVSSECRLRIGKSGYLKITIVFFTLKSQGWRGGGSCQGKMS